MDKLTIMLPVRLKTLATRKAKMLGMSLPTLLREALKEFVEKDHPHGHPSKNSDHALMKDLLFPEEPSPHHKK